MSERTEDIWPLPEREWPPTTRAPYWTWTWFGLPRLKLERENTPCRCSESMVRDILGGHAGCRHRLFLIFEPWVVVLRGILELLRRKYLSAHPGGHRDSFRSLSRRAIP